MLAYGRDGVVLTVASSPMDVAIGFSCCNGLRVFPEYMARGTLVFASALDPSGVGLNKQSPVVGGSSKVSPHLSQI